MTITIAVEEFLSWKKTHMDNPKTYRVALRPLLDRYGNAETGCLTIENVTELVSNMSGSTFMFLTVLKIFSRYCYWAKIDFINPNLIVVKRKRDPVNQKFLTQKEIDEMCSIIEDDTFLGIRNQLLIRILLDTGCRVSEILGLKLEDINAQENKVMVVTKKSHTNRYVMWTWNTHRLLQTYLGMRVSKDWKTNQLFINKDGRRLTKRGVEYMFAKVSEEALGERHHPHECRHGKAHSIIERGGEAFAVKTVLGHKNLESALTYIRLQANESLAFALKYL
jgi:site-specific recombinase XerD